MGSTMNGLLGSNHDQLRMAEQRRERSDCITQLMGNYLLKGYTMLNEYCHRCSNILMQNPSTKENYCIACEEVDRSYSHGDNQSISSDQGTAKYIAELSLDETFGQPASKNCEKVNENGIKIPNDNVKIVKSTQPTDKKARYSSTSGRECLKSAMLAIQMKLIWATEKLSSTEDIRESIDLITLIRTCAEILE